MRLQVTHRTAYAYAEPVSLCHNIVHLTPRSTPHQEPIASAIDVIPPPRRTSPFIDSFGNRALFFAIDESHLELSVTSTVTVAVTAAPPPLSSTPWEDARAAARASIEAYPFSLSSPHVKPSTDLDAYARVSFSPGRPLVEAALDLTRRIHEDFEYDATSTTVSTPIATVLQERRGVCQDFAHLQIGCLRSLGLAARYASGYIRTLPPPGKARLVGADATHAWLAVFCPTIGWFELDPTNNLVPSTDHVIVAWGRDFEDVSPIKGVILGGGEHSMAVSVDVAPLADPPPALEEQAQQAGQ